MKILVSYIPMSKVWQYQVCNRVHQPIFTGAHYYKRKSDCLRAVNNIKKYIRGKVEVEVID